MHLTPQISKVTTVQIKDSSSKIKREAQILLSLSKIRPTMRLHKKSKKTKKSCAKNGNTSSSKSKVQLIISIPL
jgi:hypothetical protein